MIRVLLADDHGVVLQGLRSLLAADPEIEVIGTCVDGYEVVEGVGRDGPDLLIMDVQMPGLDGLEVLGRLRAMGQVPPTILITGSAGSEVIGHALAAGAWGVIMKDQAPRVILESIQAVVAGEPWAGVVADSFGHAAAVPPEALETLTAREADVVRRVVRGASNKAIARDMQIAVGTVKSHLHSAYQKLGVENRVQLTLRLRRQLPL